MEDGSCKKDSKMDANGTSDFPTKGFLMTRFKSPHADTVSTKHMGFLKNLHDFYELIVKGDKPLWLLEFGGGPSLYTLISAAKHVDKIVFAEYAESNRREVEMWVEGKTGSHDWTPYIEHVVRNLEQDSSEGAVERRVKMIREKITIIPCNINDDSILGGEYATQKFDIVQTTSVIECAVADGNLQDFYSAVGKLASHVNAGGYMQFVCATGCSFYTAPGIDHKLPVLPVESEDCVKALEMAGLTMLEHRSIPRTPTEYGDPTSWDFSTAQRKK